MRKVSDRFTSFLVTYPEVGAAYNSLGKSAGEAGPLDAGCKPDELHAAILAVTMSKFPSMIKRLSWVDDVIKGAK